jgi:hypothetical protein
VIKFIVHFIYQLARGCLPVAAHAAVGVSAHSPVADVGAASWAENLTQYERFFPKAGRVPSLEIMTA